MEGLGTGRDGGRGPSWSYLREQMGSSYCSNSSGTSGTIVSTAYTSSGGSRLSSICIEAAMHSVLEVSGGRRAPKKTEEEQIKHVKSLAKEFFGAPTANCSTNGGHGSVLEWWFAELGVGWVLHLADGASAGILEHTFYAPSWFQALAEISATIRMVSHCPDRGSIGLPSICEKEEHVAVAEREKQQALVEEFQFATFIQETMSKILTFVDFIAAAKTHTTKEVLFINRMPPPYQKIKILLGVHVALSNAVSEILLSFQSSPFQVESIREEMVNLVCEKVVKAREAIWSTLEEVRTRILEPTDNSSSTQTPQESSDIHKITRSVMVHINFLLDNYLSVKPIVSEAANHGKHVPQIGDMPPLDSMVMDMMSCLEERLLNISESFPDQGLRFLFLLNNSDFIRNRLQDKTAFCALESHVAALFEKVEGFMQSYLQASWAPVLSCLFNPTPLCFRKNNSLLSNFESEFHRTCNTQKLWKVPYPVLRNRLRKAIRKKIISGYTKYLDDNDINTSNSTLQNLEEMLQELFEG